MGRRTDEWMDEWTGRWVSGWTDGQTLGEGRKAQFSASEVKLSFTAIYLSANLILFPETWLFKLFYHLGPRLSISQNTNINPKATPLPVSLLSKSGRETHLQESELPLTVTAINFLEDCMTIKC